MNVKPVRKFTREQIDAMIAGDVYEKFSDTDLMFDVTRKIMGTKSNAQPCLFSDPGPITRRRDDN